MKKNAPFSFLRPLAFWAQKVSSSLNNMGSYREGFFFFFSESMRKFCGNFEKKHALPRQERARKFCVKFAEVLRNIFCKDPFPNDPRSELLRKVPQCSRQISCRSTTCKKPRIFHPCLAAASRNRRPDLVRSLRQDPKRSHRNRAVHTIFRSLLNQGFLHTGIWHRKQKCPFPGFLLISAVLRVQRQFQNPRQTPVRTKLRLKRFPKFVATTILATLSGRSTVGKPRKFLSSLVPEKPSLFSLLGDLEAHILLDRSHFVAISISLKEVLRVQDLLDMSTHFSFGLSRRQKGGFGKCALVPAFAVKVQIVL